MRNKFTKQAQTALTLAKAAAIDFELGYIGTEHLLLSISPVSLANCITIVPDWTHIAKPVSTISVIFMRNTCRRVSKNSWTQRMGR